MAKSPLALTAALMIGLSAPALAQPFQGAMTRADANGDGAITKEEALEARRTMFDRIDRNADGQIDATEREALRARIAATANVASSAVVLRAQRMDEDGDGLVTLDEFMAETPMFDRIDQNGDGVASADEIATAQRFMANRRQ
jgi:Ca2+-binding EF-hand superfamily protein